MRKFFHQRVEEGDVLSSRLFDQNSFYTAFIHDLSNCTEVVIIESPFITRKRMANLMPIFRKLAKRGVRIIINTRPPEEHEYSYRLQAEEAVALLQDLDVLVLFTAGHHRKTAVLDQTITWEGSLNILSQNDTCEIMRRIMSLSLAQQMINFLKLEKYLLMDRS